MISKTDPLMMIGHKDEVKFDSAYGKLLKEE